MKSETTSSEMTALKLLADCRGKLMAVAATLTGDAHERDDLVMRTVERAMANFASFDPAKGSLEVWMATILRNLHASDHRRKLDGKVETMPTDELETTLSPVDNSTLQGILRNSDRDALKAAIDTMKKSDREALAMFYFLEMPIATMARVLCQPVGTVKCRLARARAALGEILVKRYGRESFVALMASALATTLLFHALVEPQPVETASSSATVTAETGIWSAPDELADAIAYAKREGLPVYGHRADGSWEQLDCSDGLNAGGFEYDAVRF